MPNCTSSKPWLARLLTPTLQALLLTLLFLTAVGCKRTWDLRAYTGDALALLTGRLQAYGYRIVEHFLSLLAKSGAADLLTDALAGWTAQLWLRARDPAEPLIVYVDGHRKPLFSDVCLPRGLIGRTGKILGCRALVLLHDAMGHVLLATTHRGDQHLTIGLPAILAHYERVNPQVQLSCVVVDREGMSAAWLAQLVQAQRTVVTILRSDQYAGLDTFEAVGSFEPLLVDEQGTVLREVAPAQFRLSLPDRSAPPLLLSVALIRDHRWQVPLMRTKEAEDGVKPRWDADLERDGPAWWEDDWQAPPAPAQATQAKLIPIVSTAETRDAVALVQLYTRRWPCQENIVRDWLLPLGLDTNHGYAKTEVSNSEVAKQRSQLEQRQERLKRWTASARKRYGQAGRRADRRYNERKTRGEELYRQLNQQQDALVAEDVDPFRIRRAIRERKAEIDAELQTLDVARYRAEREQDAEWKKVERYCREQREVLRQLADLEARERQMYEVDNAKDQIMTVCKVALVNLGMWLREHYFPTSYAHATWKRLKPFFELKGQIAWTAETVRVELQPFNDRQLRQDLAALCEQVKQSPPTLPDGRQLQFFLADANRPRLDACRRC